MTTKSRSLTKVSCGLSVAFLAFAYTSNISAVRAQSDVPTWMMEDPISTTVKALEDRIAGLEAKVALVHEICVADDAGSHLYQQAQLDRLLKMMQTAASMSHQNCRQVDRQRGVTECVDRQSNRSRPHRPPSRSRTAAPRWKPRLWRSPLRSRPTAAVVGARPCCRAAGHHQRR